jgi:hypothetical protein
MSVHQLFTTRAVTSAAALFLSACGSVAGPDYTGEVTLALGGQVVDLSEKDQDLVPALSFFSPTSLVLLDGDVQGKFPSEFVFRVSEAPPEEAMVSGFEDPESLALGNLVMVPKDHPQRIAFEDFIATTPSSELGEPDPDTGEYTRVDTACSPDESDCEVRTYTCRPANCEPVLSREGPASEAWNWSDGLVTCTAGTCLTLAQTCDEERCEQKMWACETEVTMDRNFADGTFDRCSLERVEGTRPVLDRISSYFILDLVVAFAAEAMVLPVLDVQLEQGYNVLRSMPPESNEAWANERACQMAAEAKVFSTASFEGSEEEINAQTEELDARVAELGAACPKGGPTWERLEEPESVKLRIQLGAPGSLF